MAGVVGLVAGLLVLRGWDEAGKVAGVVSILLAVAPLGAGLWAWSRREPAGLTGALVAQARELLAARVGEQWRRESAARALGDPEPMPVRWALTERAVMDHPHLVLSGPGLDGSSADIAELAGRFTRLPRRRLVILGPAGAGKTTLAVQLLLQLLTARSAQEPVPVLLSLAGWDTTTTPRLQDWLTDRLGRDYPAVRAVHPDVARELVEQGFVLPVLDGLDELPDESRPAVITAINSSLTARDQLVLTCRTAEYRAAVADSDVLTAAAVIEPEPLHSTAIADYLLTCLPPEPGEPWRVVLAAVRAGGAPALAEVCATPLGLWLVRMVYIAGRADPAPLLDHTDAATLRIDLLDQLIPTVIRTRPPVRRSDDPLRPRRRWDPDDVRRWLALFAQHLHGTRDLLWWHLPRHTLNPPLVGLMAGLTAGLVAGLGFGLEFRLLVGLVVGLAVGLGFGLAVGKDITDSEPKYANFHRHGQARLHFRGLVGGGLALSLVGGLAVGLVGGLAVGLGAGLAFGLLFGLSAWVETPGTGDRAGTPLSTYYSDRAVTVIQTALGALGGLVVWLVFGLAGGLLAGLAVGFAVGRVAGRVAGRGGGSRAWLYSVIAARWLAITGRLPWRLMGFLDDAYRLGLLRTVGPAYQFRHAELQDHLANSHPPRHSHTDTARAAR